jgi:hypothetical protein
VLTGYVDGLQDGELFGWALDTDAPGVPLVLTVLVDGVAVASVLAASQRGDVAAAYGTSGYHGFGVYLPRCAGPASAATIDVRLPDGHRLAGVPLQAAIPEDTDPVRPVVIFVHIPKTAGTALREAIEEAYRPSERLHLYSQNAFHPAGLQAWQLPLDQRARLRLVSGHVGVGVHEALPGPSTYVTFLRHPFARLRSQYVHFLRHYPEGLLENGRTLTLAEVIERPTSVAFDNSMVRMIAGVDDADYPIGTIDDAVLETALSNLQRRFGFVGTQERAEASYRRLCALFGWSARPSLHRTNVTADAGALPGEARARELATVHARWDFRLYEAALDLSGPGA